MHKFFPRMLGATLAGTGIAFALFWLATRMIASDTHGFEKKAIQLAFRHPLHRPALPAQAQLADSASANIEPLPVTTQRTVRKTEKQSMRTASAQPPVPRFKHATPLNDIRPPDTPLPSIEKIAKVMNAALAISHLDQGIPYLPAPNTDVLHTSKLHATQMTYVCPRYPDFPHIGLDLEFSAHVNRRGRVVDFAVINGNMRADYRAALRQAVLQWRFSPLRKNGTRLPFRLVDRVHVASVGHACVYNYMTAGQPKATGRVPDWKVYFTSGASASPVVMKRTGLP